MSEAVISIRNLVKCYGKIRALDGIDLDIPPGPVGLLGPNGSGKTTLLKLLLGLLIPTEGEATVLGYRPTQRRDRLSVRTVVGYMPEGDCILPGMSAIELVSTLARITGLRAEDAMKRAHEVLDYVQLEEERYRPTDGYSTGMKQRLKLAQALVHDPQLLLLDEPTNGLDPKGRRQMLDLVEDLGRTQGKNILLCSHLLQDVERTCDHVVVLNDGRVVEQGSVSELTAAKGALLLVEVEGDPARFIDLLCAAGLETSQGSEGGLRVQWPDANPDADRVFGVAQQAGIAITQLRQQRSSLEDVFLRAVGAKPHTGSDSNAPNRGENRDLMEERP
jgi:ABC-2 type transport system ATP-binding protein